MNGTALAKLFPYGICHSRMAYASQEYAKNPPIREWHRVYSRMGLIRGWARTHACFLAPVLGVLGVGKDFPMMAKSRDRLGVPHHSWSKQLFLLPFPVPKLPHFALCFGLEVISKLAENTGLNITAICLEHLERFFENGGHGKSKAPIST